MSLLNLYADRGVTISYTYDSLGNTATESGGYEYRYDEENRLRKVMLNGATIANYWYGMQVPACGPTRAALLRITPIAA